MSRDPFEHLREANPLPDQQPVYPPMSTVDRILGGAGRRAWPSWALAGGLALAVLIGGGAWLLWARGGTQELAATTVAPTTTQAAATTTVIPAFPEDDAVVYFYADVAATTQDVAGPYLIAVARPYAVLSHWVEDPVYETLNFLLIGTAPGEEEADPPLVSYLPEGTAVLGIEVGEGVATVNLSDWFGAGSDGADVLLDAAAVRRGLAQIVFTLTRFPDIASVRFLVDGEPAPGLDAAGLQPSGEAVRGDFQDLLPPIMIENPVYWAGSGDNPLLVEGTANVFEAVVGLELLDEGGAVLWEGTATASCGTGCRGGFSVEIPYEVAAGQIGTLVAWEASTEDGSRRNVRQHPVWLNATPGITTTTSVDPVAALLAERYDLDKALDAYLEEQAAIDAQLAGLPLDQGTELRTRAAQLDQQVEELRQGLLRVFDGLTALGAEVAIPCSAGALAEEFVEQPELPDQVEDVRHALFDYARACNWESLRGLLDPATFSYSFGEDGDPIGFWQRMEYLHYEPMLYVAGMLQRPYGLVADADPAIYAWPSAHAYGAWEAVPEAEKEALRPLYGDLDFGFFEEFGGYLGYRVGITLDGDRAQWIYAISGD